MMALHKANPKFGSVGHNASVEFPLPGSLEVLLKKSILKRAKSDNLAKTLKRIQKEPEVQAVVREHKEVLKRNVPRQPYPNRNADPTPYPNLPPRCSRRPSSPSRPAPTRAPPTR